MHNCLDLSHHIRIFIILKHFQVDLDLSVSAVQDGGNNFCLWDFITATAHEHRRFYIKEPIFKRECYQLPENFLKESLEASTLLFPLGKSRRFSVMHALTCHFAQGTAIEVN